MLMLIQCTVVLNGNNMSSYNRANVVNTSIELIEAG